MNIIAHQINTTNIAEVISENLLINNAEAGLELLGNIYYQGFDQLILHSNNITPAFFDLKNGIAGEILQKFSNYKVRLAIVGDFSNYTSQSIKDFMYESNKAGHINFVGSLEEALNKLSKV